MAPRQDAVPRRDDGELDALFLSSISLDPADPRSDRYSVRRAPLGLELFVARYTRDVGGEAEFHGYPTSWVPAKVLRALRDDGRITQPEYKRLARRLG